MCGAIRLYRGSFGRVSVLNIATSLVTHAHDVAHIVVWCDGPPGEMIVGGEARRLGPTTAATINPFVPHSHTFCSPRAGLFLAFYIDPDWLMQHADLAGDGTAFAGNFMTLNAMQHAVARRIFGYFSDEPGEEQLLPYEIERFVDSMVRPHAARRPRYPAPRSLTDFRVRKALKIMRANVSERICFDELARSVGLSRPHFFALFKEQTGATPNIYWNALRTDEATRQLECTEESLISVACNLGFSTQGNFSRFFRDHVGVPPRTYRSAARTLA